MHNTAANLPDVSLMGFLLSPFGVPFLIIIPICVGLLIWCTFKIDNCKR